MAVGYDMNINVNMNPSGQLDEVIVNALGLEKKKDDDLSSSSIVKIDELQRSGEAGVFAETAPMNIISFREVKLIEAEAANRTGHAGDITAFNEVRTDLETQYETGSFPATTSTSGSDELLKEIIEEKYICLIGELQPFHDVRRTNNILGIPAKVGSTIPQRFIYPQVEIDTNPNVPSPLPTLFDKTPINKFHLIILKKPLN